MGLRPPGCTRPCRKATSARLPPPLLARRPEIVDLMRGGPAGFEIRALHIAVMKRDVVMTRLLLEAGADTRAGIWPNRDATGPLTIAEERGYDEIVAIIVAQEETRGAR